MITAVLLLSQIGFLPDSHLVGGRRTPASPQIFVHEASPRPCLSIFAGFELCPNLAGIRTFVRACVLGTARKILVGNLIHMAASSSINGRCQNVYGNRRFGYRTYNTTGCAPRDHATSKKQPNIRMNLHISEVKRHGTDQNHHNQTNGAMHSQATT